MPAPALVAAIPNLKGGFLAKASANVVERHAANNTQPKNPSTPPSKLHKIVSEFPLESGEEHSLLDEQSALISKVIGMYRYFEKLGHFNASIDPLKLPREPPMITNIRHDNTNQCANSFQSFGFTNQDKNKKIKIALPNCGGLLGDLGVNSSSSPGANSMEAEVVRSVPYTSWLIGDLYDRLRGIYCGNIGVEYLHILNRDRLNWLRNELELPRPYKYSEFQKKEILNRVIRAVLFEKFARMKFSTVKRFGLDGCECFVVGLEHMLNIGIDLGLESVVLGMTHRGRLNTLANIMKKPKNQIFSEFMGHTGFGNSQWGNIGDVKYHMGAECVIKRTLPNGASACAKKGAPPPSSSILYTLLPNPSHLEAVDSVVLGTARARQDLWLHNQNNAQKSADAACVPREEAWRRIVPVIVHGDASIAGQGVVYEICQMSALKNYIVGGAIHIVINNQIGFTTNPSDGSSGNYCTDVAKCIEAPIFHVNGDDPEAVSRVMEIAIKFRQKFNSDVFVDIVGYRREGHNELDMPKFTHPQMYRVIEQHPNVLDIYSEQLIKEKVISKKEVETLKQNAMSEFNEGFENAKQYKPQPRLRPFNPQWQDQMLPTEYSRPRCTGVTGEKLLRLGKKITTLPKPERFHPTIQRVYKARADALAAIKVPRAAATGASVEEPHDKSAIAKKADGSGSSSTSSSTSGSKGGNAAPAALVDFGFAESLAFATLMEDGVHVRLMGQDCERGTFSHRHAKLFDQNSKGGGSNSYCPLSEVGSELGLTGSFEVGNSLLSEYGALGFEYGYSLESPNVLPIWEAQFGDFANGGQIMIDQFITSGETKWSHPSAITLMLPHGYDGQGSEHSSARIERFLQMCDDREDLIEPTIWDVNKRSVTQKHNIQIVNCSTPANLFHVLRRQIHRGFRKPLILITGKKMLRLKEAASPVSDFLEETRFRRYLTDPTFAPPKPLQGLNGAGGAVETVENSATGGSAPGLRRTNVDRLILCSGQVYYDLIRARAQKKLDSRVLISRVEQLSPFPFDRVLEDVVSLPYLKSIVWCQEEPMNMGAWSYIKPRIETVLSHSGYYNGLKKIIYAGRDISSAPASGDANIHKQELDQLLKDALDLSRTWNSNIEKYHFS